MKKLGWEKSYPDWQVSKLRLLERVFTSDDFKKEAAWRRRKAPETFLTHATALLVHHHLPYGCLGAVVAYLEGKDFKVGDVEAWVQHVTPEPVQYINLYHHVLGPSRTPHEDYDALRNEDIDFADFFHDYTLLALPPNITRKEVEAFLDKHFGEMKTYIDDPTSDLTTPRIVQKRITKLAPEDARIVEMRKAGAKFADIAKELNTDSDARSIRRKHDSTRRRLKGNK